MSDRCTIQLANGAFCDAEPTPIVQWYPVCARHARHIFRDVLSVYLAEAENPARILAELDAGATAGPDRSAEVIYYLALDGMVKIGYTTDLERRMQQYPPSASLVATEPGSRDTEKRRHLQFAEYLTARREWFTPGPRLRAHIESLVDYRAA